MSDDIIKRLREAIAAGEFNFGNVCCGEGEWNGSPFDPPECCGRPITYADNIATLLDRLDAMEREIERLKGEVNVYRNLAESSQALVEVDAAINRIKAEYGMGSSADLIYQLCAENERLRDLLARTLGGHRDLDLQDAIIAALDAARSEK